MNANDISKIEELENTIKEAQRQIEEIKNGDKKLKAWRPKSNELYLDWRMLNYDRICKNQTLTKNEYNEGRILRYNTINKSIIESTVKLLQIRDVLCPDFEPDLGDICYRVMSKKGPTSCYTVCCYLGCDVSLLASNEILFDTEEHAQIAADILNGKKELAYD